MPGENDGNDNTESATPPADDPTVEGSAAQSDPNLNDVSEVMNFDPFEAEDAPTNPDGGQDKPPTEGEAPTEGDAADGTADGSQPAKVDDKETPEGEADPIEALAKAGKVEPAVESASTNALLEKALNIIEKTGGQGQPAKTEGATDDKAAPESPYKNAAIPQQIVGLIESEDPQERLAGMTALMQGTMNTVHTQVMKAVTEQLGGVSKSFPELIQSAIQAHTQSVQVFNDFYGSHPEFNDPKLYKTVQDAAAELAKETGVDTYDEKFKAALVKRLQDMGIKGKSTQKPAGNETPPKGGAKMLDGGSTRTDAPPKDDQQAEIDDMVFGG